MKSMKKWMAGGLAALLLAAGSVTAFAATYNTPAEAAAGVTGKTLEEVYAEWDAGKSYGAIAEEAGKLEEFQKAIREIQQEILDARVADRTLTQEQADDRIAAIEERQATCGGAGNRAGCGMGYGGGYGGGRGQGRGLRDGSCWYR